MIGELANDKRIHSETLVVETTAELALTLPETPGHYVVKAFVTSRDGKRFAAGHIRMKTTR